MISDPWAKLKMRGTPKISDRPADTRKSDDAPARPLSSCTSSAEAVTRELWQQRNHSRALHPTVRRFERARSVGGPVRAHPIVSGKIVCSVGVAPVDHDALAVL